MFSLWFIVSISEGISVPGTTRDIYIYIYIIEKSRLSYGTVNLPSPSVTGRGSGADTAELLLLFS